MPPIINKLFIEPTNNSAIQLFRYCFVGGFAFAVDYGGLFVLTRFCGLHYLLSATISFIAGLVVNYLLSTSWIFRVSKLKSRTGEFIVYGLIGVVGLGLNDLFLYLLTDGIGIHYMISKIFTAAVGMLWNFFARKIILFSSTGKA